MMEHMLDRLHLADLDSVHHDQSDYDDGEREIIATMFAKLAMISFTAMLMASVLGEGKMDL